MNDEHYLVPTGDGKNNIEIDLAEIVKSEIRLGEVATVNQTTAPELLSTYNEIWLKLQRLTTRLVLEKEKAKNSVKRYKAEAKLACTDDFIKARGHAKTSADLREAIAELDEKVIEAKDRYDSIAVILSLIEGKREAFYNAYNSVKKLTYFGQLAPKNYGDGNMPVAFGAKDSNEESDEYKLPDGFVNPRR